MASSSWNDYEVKFIELLNQAKQQGAEVLVTGDLICLNTAVGMIE